MIRDHENITLWDKIGLWYLFYEVVRALAFDGSHKKTIEYIVKERKNF